MTICVALALCGCATQAQRQFQAIRTGNQTNVAELKACAANVYNSPDYAPIRAHVPLLVTDATLQQLSNENHATPAEAQSILNTHPRLQECRKTFLVATAQTEPGLVPVLTAAYNKNDDDLLALTRAKTCLGRICSANKRQGDRDPDRDNDRGPSCNVRLATGASGRDGTTPARRAGAGRMGGDTSLD